VLQGHLHNNVCRWRISQVHDSQQSGYVHLACSALPSTKYVRVRENISKEHIQPRFASAVVSVMFAPPYSISHWIVTEFG
jgi:hypothetical protein